MRAPVLLVALLLAACGSSSARTESAASEGQPAKAQAQKPAAQPIKHQVVKGRHDQPVPILMYHVISDPPPGTPFPNLWVSRQDFAAHMQLLAAKGYHGVTLDQVLDHWYKAFALPSKPVVVSFDDGYFSQYKNAAPVLKRLGWPGVLNLAVKNLGIEGGLNGTEVKRMLADGWELDAHTIHHLDLTTLDDAQLQEEVAGSREALRKEFGVPVDAFCYPSGRFNPTVEAAVKAAGYRAATTVERGLARPKPDRYALKRVRVNRGDTPQELLAKIVGGGR